MPSDAYLLIAGVNGESQATGMTNNIELDSWSWGGAAPSDVGNKGLSAGKPSFSDFSCSFSLDAASFQLVSNLCKGTHIANATFSGRKTGGGANPYVYLVITLTNCFITGFSTGGGSTGTPSASMSISYEQVMYQYYTQDTSSGAVTLAGAATYNIGQVATS